MTQVIGAALQLGGMPVPVGGGVRLVDALAGIVTDAGGEVRLSADVRQILVANGRATGVRLTDGEVVAATRAVVANVTPTQLYGSLLGGSDVPTAVAEAAARFRYGRAEMQIHLALDEPPRWKGREAERLARCPIVHVTPGLDGVSRAVNEAERGLLPAEATIVCGQPVRARPVARARTASRSSGSSCRSSRPAGSRAMLPASSTPATAPGPTSSARRTPTGSSPGSATRSRTSARRR